jgi:hypothetical protein
MELINKRQKTVHNLRPLQSVDVTPAKAAHHYTPLYMRILLHIIFCLLFVLNYSYGFSQNNDTFYSFLIKGDSLYYSKNYSEALTFYTKAIQYKERPRISDLLKFATCASNAKNQKECFNFYLKAMSNGLPLNELDNILEKNDSLSNDYKKRLLDKYDSLHKKYTNSLNFDLCFKLSQMAGVDEGIRLGKIIVSDTNCQDIYNETYNSKQLTVDSANFNRLVILIKEYGWLTHDLIGTQTDYVTIILWHYRGKYCNTKDWLYIKEIISKQIENGQVEPWFFAAFEDFAYYQKNKMQLYGTMVEYNNGKSEYVPIFDIANIDKRRKQFGMEDLKTNSIKKNVFLPVDYK